MLRSGMLKILVEKFLTWAGRRTTSSDPTRIEIIIAHVLYLTPFLAIGLLLSGKFVFDLTLLMGFATLTYALAFTHLWWAVKFRAAKPDDWLASHMVYLWGIYARIFLSAGVFALLLAVSILFAAMWPYLLYVPFVAALLMVAIPLFKAVSGYSRFVRKLPARLSVRQARQLEPMETPPSQAINQLHPSLRPPQKSP